MPNAVANTALNLIVMSGTLSQAGSLFNCDATLL
jgi:hypothetical protein